MDLTKLIQTFLKKNEIKPKRTDFGLQFAHDNLTFFYFHDKDDEQYFQLVLPHIFDVDENNETAVLRAINTTNRNVKVVKLYVSDSGSTGTSEVWAGFEILADSSPEIQDILPRAIQLLEAARDDFYHQLDRA